MGPSEMEEMGRTVCRSAVAEGKLPWSACDCKVHAAAGRWCGVVILHVSLQLQGVYFRAR